MSKTKVRFKTKWLAIVMATVFLIGMVPIGLIAQAVESDYDYLSAQNLSALYNKTTDTIEVTWDTIAGETDELTVAIGDGSYSVTPLTATSYSEDVSSYDGGEYTVSLTAGFEGHSRMVSTTVTVPYHLNGITAPNAVNVANDLTIANIASNFPSAVSVSTTEGETLSASVSWNTASTDYQKNETASQSFSVTGTVTLPNTVINPQEIALTTSLTVNVAAAVATNITSDIAATASKNVDEGFALSVTAEGTSVSYQWYKNNTAITGATGSSYSITKVALTDAGSYFCRVSGKTGNVDSNTCALTVSKITPSLVLSIDPSSGQTRPAPITLSVSGIPNDATGTITFYDGENNIGSVSLPTVSYNFRAQGSKNDYVFKAVYSGNTTKYTNAESEPGSYSFTKGTQTVSFDPAGGLPTGALTYSDGLNFTVKAVKSDTTYGGDIRYYLTEQKLADGTNGTVAEINETTGVVSVKNAGTFKVQIKALGNDNYNESAVVTSSTITVNRATQKPLTFSKSSLTATYCHDFSLAAQSPSGGSGNGAISYSVAGGTAEGFVINSTTGELTFTYNDTDSDPSCMGHVGTVVVKVTKAADNQYGETSAEYTVTIGKAQQSTFAFSVPAPEAVAYEQGGKSFINPISDTDKGTVTAKPVFSVKEQKSLDGDPVNVLTEDGINSDTGAFVAARSGVVTVKAALTGNGVYDGTDCEYTLTVNRGTVEKGETGFRFASEESGTETTIRYHQIFVNAAAGGQTDSTQTVVYSIEGADSETPKTAPNGELQVTDNGGILFLKNPLYATNEDYTVTVLATKPETDQYDACTISYELTVTRDAVTVADFLVNGSEIKDASRLTEPDGWYLDETVTLTPAGIYDKICLKDGIEETMTTAECPFVNDLSFGEGVTVSAFYLKDEDTGAISQVTEQTVNYDKTKAVIDEFESNERFWDRLLEMITFGLWKSENYTVSIHVLDNPGAENAVTSGILKAEYVETTDINKYDTEEAIIESLAETEWIACEDVEIGKSDMELFVTFTYAEGFSKKKDIFVKLTDCAGNVSYFRSNGVIMDGVQPTASVLTESSSITIDVTLPDAEETTRTENINLYKAEVPFGLTVSDSEEDASGIRSIKVEISGQGMTEDEQHADAQFSKIFFIRATESEIKQFSYSYADGAVNDLSDFEFYTLTKDPETQEDLEQPIDPKEAFLVPADFNSNYLTIKVTAIDYAGNQKVNADTHLAVDTINPFITVTYTASNSTEEDAAFLNGNDTFGYIGNNQNRKAHIYIQELNFDQSFVEFTVKRDGEPLEITPTFEPVPGDVSFKGEQLGWAMELDFATLVTDDGNEFTFEVEYTDRAGNKTDDTDETHFTYDCIYPNCFVIDNTKPTITVEFDNNDVKNEKYFKADRTATVTIKERFFSKDYLFDWSGLTLGGAADPNFTRIIKVFVGSQDDTYIHQYTLGFREEGDYTFDVKYTDLAGNLSEAYACNSAAHKEFTVDKTKPELAITGVVNESANNGTVAPIITYSDTNLDRNTVMTTLNGVNKGTVKYNNVFGTTEKGGSVTFMDFQHAKDIDDIYTLTAAVADKAGNASDKKIVFSVNRFGSTYDLSKLSHINGHYLQQEEDIVFTEVNVDTIKPESLRLKMTKNGTPSDLKEGADYSVTKNESKWSSWSSYVYTVKKDLFADDGKYSISVYSVDAAENINENINETKAADISFGVDKTKPVVVPIDFESGVQYPVESKKVSVDIKDNLVLGKVKIYLNDKELNYETSGETYLFDIPESNRKQTVRIVALDAAGNEQELAVKEFLVSTNIFVRWYNNTVLFVCSIVGFAVILLALITLLIVKKKRSGR